MNKKLKLALINSGIAGALVFCGAFASGNITYHGVIAAISASLVVFFTKIRDFLDTKPTKKQKNINSCLLFNFYG